MMNYIKYIRERNKFVYYVKTKTILGLVEMICKIELILVYWIELGLVLNEPIRTGKT